MLVAQMVERCSVSILHAHIRRAGNCIGLLSNTALLLSTDSKYSFSSLNATIPYDSSPLRQVVVL